jgi:hypothetical protein
MPMNNTPHAAPPYVHRRAANGSPDRAATTPRAMNHELVSSTSVFSTPTVRVRSCWACRYSCGAIARCTMKITK